MSAKRLLFLGNSRSPRCLLEKIQIRELQAGEVLCKVKLSTLCSSDLHTLNGLRKEETPRYTPLDIEDDGGGTYGDPTVGILGHECVAEVVESKSDNTDIKPGHRVVFSLCRSCFKCNVCQKGLPQKCIKLYKYGHSQLKQIASELSGCYASHIILFPGTQIVRIPDHVTDKMAAPISCALATMVNAVSSLPKFIDENSRVLVQGAGLLGIYACALLREAGHQHVYCTDVLVSRLQYIRPFGGQSILAGEEYDYIQEHSLDAVIEVCGVRSAIATGMDLLRPGGTYIFVGLVHPKSELNITAELLIRKCLTLKGIHNYAPEHLTEAVNFISKTAAKYPWEKLIGPSFPLVNFEKAVEEAEKRIFPRIAISPEME